MLIRLQVRNFRSIENIDFPLGTLVALVGPNGVGKTAILRAIDLVLGDSWPSLRSFRVPQDFTNFETSRHLEIITTFDPPFVHRDTHSNEHSVSSLRLTCKPYKRSGKWGSAGDLHVDLDPLGASGEVPSVAVGQPTRGQKTLFSPLRVGTDLRDHARVLFIDHRRNLAQHLPSVRGSVLGRLLQPALKEFKAQEDFLKAYEQTMDLLRTDQVKQIEDTVAETAKRMLGFLGGGVGQSVQISFGFADPANPFNSLRLQYRETGLCIPGEELGLGIQSAMVVGIFEAFRKIGGNYGTLIIEEPEMYLHPQAQRYFYRLLCQMTDAQQCQVIYSTHSPIFADANRYEALRLVRRTSQENSRVSYVPQADQASLGAARDAYKLGGKFDTGRNEVLFASRALLTEGYADRLAALMLAEKLGIDPDAEGIAVVDCGGKSGIELVVRVCRALEIPFAVVHDSDKWPLNAIADDVQRRKQQEENESKEQKNQRIQEAVGEAGRVFVIIPTLEEALGIGRSASDKPRRVAEALGSLAEGLAPRTLEPLILALRALVPDANAEGCP